MFIKGDIRDPEVQRLMRENIVGDQGMIHAELNPIFGPWYCEFDGVTCKCGPEAYRDLRLFWEQYKQAENN